MAPLVERGDHVSCSRAVILHARDAELDHVADIRKSRAFVHALILPFLVVREVEGAEEGHSALQELEGHEGVRRRGTLEVVEAMGEKKVVT